MTLGDLSNLVLIELQQSGAQFATGGATAPGPNWAGVQNPQYSQGLVEFAVNEGYKKMMGDIEMLELALIDYTFLDHDDVHLPVPAGADRVARVPGSLAYRAHLLPSVRLAVYARVPAGDRACVVGEVPARHGPGLSFAVQLRYAADLGDGGSAAPEHLLLSRQCEKRRHRHGPVFTDSLAVYRWSRTDGLPDSRELTDTPITPYDTHMAIFYYAMHLLWIRAREADQAKVSRAMYDAEIKLIKDKYTKITHADTITVEPFMDSLAIGGPR